MLSPLSINSADAGNHVTGSYRFSLNDNINPRRQRRDRDGKESSELTARIENIACSILSSFFSFSSFSWSC